MFDHKQKRKLKKKSYQKSQYDELDGIKYKLHYKL